MALQDVHLTLEDHKILDAFDRMLEGLSEYLGDGYELILYGAAAQGGYAPLHILGAGAQNALPEEEPFAAPPPSLLRRLQPEGAPPTDYASFNCNDLHGEPMHCTVIALRGSGGQIIGLLCINFYMNTPLRCVLNTFVRPQPAAPETPGIHNSEDIVTAAVHRTVAAVDALGVSPSSRNREIVTRLYDEGIFNIKEAVVRVADMLQLSKNTVYLHLRGCKKRASLPASG